jgi:Rne/Rng family ribonuclease
MTASGRRRRRKRRRGSDGDVASPDDPPDTVVHVREAHNPVDDVRAIKGSTRLEAKKQRRREGRESGRRRSPVITESEFLARRESVDRTMVVRQRGDRTQIAVLEDGVLVEHYVNRTTHQSYVGNVYLGKVQNVLPSMEAAFVDIGKGRNAVLYAGEVNFDASGLEGQPKRIESALKAGQSVIVQVTKDPVGHKGARLTSQVSLPGRYLVYVPGASMTGISRKLPDTERNRLKHILKKVMPEHAGVIVRTAAEGAAEAELDRDVTRLAAQWENIERKAKTASAPALLYGEPDLTIRVVRDVFNEDFSQLIVSGDEGWEVIDEYVRYVAPHLADRLTRWEGSQEASDSDFPDDVFAVYRVDEQLGKALDRKVWLPSGGSLVIDRTEAMTVIDVNTGKFTGQGGNLEETVTRNNLEAAEEIVRQLRLRDVGGIVVIDFIDMVLESNRDLVLRRMLECLARDRTKHQVAEVTSLGLVQMTRKRVGAGLLEAFSQPCECCNGRGVIVTIDPTEPGHRSTAGHAGHSGHASSPAALQPKRSGNGSGNGGSGNGGGNNGSGNGGGNNGSGNGGSSNGHGRSDQSSGGSGNGSAVESEQRSEPRERGGRRGRRERAASNAAVASAVASAAKVASAAVTSSAWPDSDSGVASEDLAPEALSAVGESSAVAEAAEESSLAPTPTDAATDTGAPVRRTRTRGGSAMARRAQVPEEPVNLVVASAPPVPVITEESAEAPSAAEASATAVTPVTAEASATAVTPAEDAATVAEASAEDAAAPVDVSADALTESVATPEGAAVPETAVDSETAGSVTVEPASVESAESASAEPASVESASAESAGFASAEPTSVESFASAGSATVTSEPAESAVAESATATAEPAVVEPAAVTEPEANVSADPAPAWTPASPAVQDTISSWGDPASAGETAQEQVQPSEAAPLVETPDAAPSVEGTSAEGTSAEGASAESASAEGAAAEDAPTEETSTEAASSSEGTPAADGEHPSEGYF